MRAATAAALAALVSAAAAVPAPARAQATPDPQRNRDAGSDFHASPYLPLGHWAYDIVDYWVASGRVEGLSPLVKPYRRMDVARAVREVQRSRHYAWQTGWIERLVKEFRPELARLEGEGRATALLRGRIRAGGEYWSQTHRDPLRPVLEGDFATERLLERAFLHLEGRAGPVVGAFRAGRDGIFRHDAQFPDGRVVPEKSIQVVGLDELGVRVEESYAEVQTEYARLFFGRMYRNWGLPGMPGFVRSDYAYSYDELAYRVGTEAVRLSGSVSSLGDFGGDTTRYLATHRLEVRPVDELVLAVTEAVVHGGPSQPLRLGLVNPLNIWHIVESDAPANFVGQLDAWWRPVQGLALYGSLLADATNSPAGEDESCCQMGGSLGVELPGLVRGWRFRLQASSVQSLAYRTGLPWEEWSVEGVGLGWDKADLHLLTLEAEWLGNPELVLRPRLDVQARGERSDFAGDLRPPADQLPDFPRVLAGEAELTIRPSLRGRWRPDALGAWDLDVTWDVGRNIIKDFRHEPGRDLGRFVGRVRVLVESPPVRLPIE